MTTNAERQAVIRDLEAALGPETLSKARYRLHMEVAERLTGLVAPLLLVLLWLPTGWAVDLRKALHAGEHWWATWKALLVFMGSAMLLSLPLDGYFRFRLENRLGTNRQSLGGWLKDWAKQGVANLVLQSLFFLGVYLVFRRWPDRWLVGLVIAVLVFLVVFYFLNPLLLRMQYKSTPLDDPELNARLQALFAQVGVPYAGVGVLQVGEKTSRATAALVPRGAGTQVVVSNTLLDILTPEEVVTAVAHELGHKVHRDMLRLMLLMGSVVIASLALAYLVLRSAGTWDGLQGPADVATFPLLDLLLAWLMVAAQGIVNFVTRARERAADGFALALTGRPETFERVMVALAKQNKTLPQPPAAVELLFHNHPSLARRVLAARQWAAKGASGSRA